MTRSPQDIADLLGSRICHDLISPLGAIANGVELLQMAGAEMGPEIALISESVGNANARIRFFRIAFGGAARDQLIGASEIRSVLADMTGAGRLKITWDPSEDLPRREVKLAFLMLQCLETALPWGGDITVERATRWHIRASAERTKIDPATWEVLTTPQASTEIRAAEVQFLMLPLLLQAENRELRVELGETEISARF